MGGRRAEYRDCPECATLLAQRPHHWPSRGKDPLRQKRWRPTDEWRHTTVAGGSLHALQRTHEFRDCPDCASLVSRYPAILTHPRILGWDRGSASTITEQQRLRPDGPWYHPRETGRQLHWRATTAVSQWPPVTPAPRPGEPARLGLAHRIERCQCGPDWFDHAIEVVTVTVDGRSYDVYQPPCEARYTTRSDNIHAMSEKLELVLHRRLVTEEDLLRLIRARYPEHQVHDLWWGLVDLHRRLFALTPALRSPKAMYWVVRDIVRLGLPKPHRCATCQRRHDRWPTFRLPHRQLRHASEDRRWWYASKTGVFCSPECLARSDGRCAYAEARRCGKPALPDKAYCARHVDLGLEEASPIPFRQAIAESASL